MAKDFGPVTERKTTPSEAASLAELKLNNTNSSSANPKNDVTAPSLDTNTFSGATTDVGRELQRRLASRLEGEQQKSIASRSSAIEEKLAQKTSSAETAGLGQSPVKETLRQKFLNGVRSIFPHDRQSIIGKLVCGIADTLHKLERLAFRALQLFLRLFGIRIGNGGLANQQAPQKQMKQSSHSTEPEKKDKKKLEGRSGAARG